MITTIMDPAVLTTQVYGVVTREDIESALAVIRNSWGLIPTRILIPRVLHDALMDVIDDYDIPVEISQHVKDTHVWFFTDALFGSDHSALVLAA